MKDEPMHNAARLIESLAVEPVEEHRHFKVAPKEPHPSTSSIISVITKEFAEIKVRLASEETRANQLAQANVELNRLLKLREDEVQLVKAMASKWLEEYSTMHRYYWNGYRELDAEPFVRETARILGIPPTVKITYEGHVQRICSTFGIEKAGRKRKGSNGDGREQTLG